MQTCNEWLTPEGVRTIELALDWEHRLNRTHIGTEQLLLALLFQGDAMVELVFNKLGVDAERVRERIEFIIERGEGPGVVEPGLTRRAKRVLRLAVEEAAKSSSSRADPIHSLIALLAEGEGIASLVLQEQGLTVDGVRIESDALERRR